MRHKEAVVGWRHDATKLVVPSWQKKRIDGRRDLCEDGPQETANMTNTTVAPVINLNGTDPRALLDQYRQAQHTAEAMSVCLRETMPHARDFQTAPEGLYVQARDQHLALLRQSEAIEAHFRALKIAVMRQMSSSNRARSAGE